ncbi:MAG TPA: antibiotic biosynthesis monooxygenase [Terriglobales bacterium]
MNLENAAADYNLEMVSIVWEFRVREDKQQEFELLYNSEGLWAILFRSSPAYQGTKLLRDTDGTRRYLTVDRWHTLLDFQQFKQMFASEYKAIDEKCEELTESERLIGVFDEI